MSEYFSEINVDDFMNRHAERINRRIDEAKLAKVEGQLAEYGYVKVVRCRDCKHYRTLNDLGLCHPLGIVLADMGNGFCAWAERRGGGND